MCLFVCVLCGVSVYPDWKCVSGLAHEGNTCSHGWPWLHVLPSLPENSEHVQRRQWNVALSSLHMLRILWFLDSQERASDAGSWSKKELGCGHQLLSLRKKLKNYAYVVVYNLGLWTMNESDKTHRGSLTSSQRGNVSWTWPINCKSKQRLIGICMASMQ